MEVFAWVGFSVTCAFTGEVIRRVTLWRLNRVVRPTDDGGHISEEKTEPDYWNVEVPNLSRRLEDGSFTVETFKIKKPTSWWSVFMYGVAMASLCAAVVQYVRSNGDKKAESAAKLKKTWEKWVRLGIFVFMVPMGSFGSDTELFRFLFALCQTYRGAQTLTSLVGDISEVVEGVGDFFVSEEDPNTCSLTKDGKHRFKRHNGVKACVVCEKKQEEKKEDKKDDKKEKNPASVKKAESNPDHITIESSSSEDEDSDDESEYDLKAQASEDTKEDDEDTVTIHSAPLASAPDDEKSIPLRPVPFVAASAPDVPVDTTREWRERRNAPRVTEHGGYNLRSGGLDKTNPWVAGWRRMYNFVAIYFAYLSGGLWGATCKAAVFTKRHKKAAVISLAFIGVAIAFYAMNRRNSVESNTTEPGSRNRKATKKNHRDAVKQFQKKKAFLHDVSGAKSSRADDDDFRGGIRNESLSEIDCPYVSYYGKCKDDKCVYKHQGVKPGDHTKGRPPCPHMRARGVCAVKGCQFIHSRRAEHLVPGKAILKTPHLCAIRATDSVGNELRCCGFIYSNHILVPRHGVSGSVKIEASPNGVDWTPIGKEAIVLDFPDQLCFKKPNLKTFKNNAGVSFRTPKEGEEAVLYFKQGTDDMHSVGSVGKTHRLGSDNSLQVCDFTSSTVSGACGGVYVAVSDKAIIGFHGVGSNSRVNPMFYPCTSAWKDMFVTKSQITPTYSAQHDKKYFDLFHKLLNNKSGVTSENLKFQGC